MNDVEGTLPVQKSAARLAAVQALYQMDFKAARAEMIIHDFMNQKMPAEGDAPTPDFDRELFASIINGTLQRMADIDPLLEANLDPKWPLPRLDKILRSILRVGAAEMLQHGKVDAAIIINDYVNVAHGFFAGKEPALVNAVLDKIAKHVRQ